MDFAGSAFAAGESVTVSFTDSGADSGGLESTADSVMVEPGFGNGEIYYSSSPTPGFNTYSTGSANLTSTGLFVHLKTGTYITGVTLTCTGSASNVATLSNLGLSAGTLTPGFSSTQTTYTASVANSIASVTVTPTITSSNATVTVDGATVTSGSASSAISLAAGSSTSIRVVVTAQDGVTTQTYTVAVTRTAAAPVAGNVSASVAANSTSNVIPLALSGGAASSVSIVSPAAHGTATASGTSITYTPAAGYSGSDSFTYDATNGSATSAPAIVTVTVGVPTLTLTPASGSLSGGTVGTAYGQTVSASGGTSPYSYVATGLPAGLTINVSTGALSGTPTASGSFTPTVTVTDAHGATGAVTYSLTIAPLPPVASAVSATVPANSTNNAVRLVVSGGAATSVAIVSAARHGIATTSGTTITYTPAPGYTGMDSFTYSATNASGSSTATVNITVTAPTLTVTPATGTSLNAPTGTAYTQTINVAGGTSPYHFTASALPAGLSIDPTTGTISGTPAATGTTTFTITSTDANGVQLQARYTLTVVGVAPVAVDRNATLYAGQTTAVSLTDGASGGPFTGATIVSAPSASQGRVTVSGHASTYTLTFAAGAQASGAVVIRYTLTNEWGTSAPATVTMQVTARPDPSKDPEVIGLLNAQAQSAEQFANAQIDNFNDRLEQLHDESRRHSNAFNVQVGLPQAPVQNQGAQAPASNAQGGPSAPTDTGGQATHDTSVPTLPHWIGDDNLAVWTGGFVNFGTSDRDDVELSHTLVGLSAGADYRFLPALVGGLGFGYGRDVSDIDNSGTESRGEAFSAAFYGSYHPGPVYIDGLLGYSHLNFDSQRYVSETGGYANGERAGDQIFGALSSGYELRSGGMLVAPYGRMQFSSTLLQHFTESGAGAFDLSYADQRLSMLSAVAGLRGEYSLPVSWGEIKLRGRLEYSHQLTGSSEARLGYSDTDDNSYAVTVLGLGENEMTAAVGIDVALPFGLTTGLTYQGMFGMSDHEQDHQVMVHFTMTF